MMKGGCKGKLGMPTKGIVRPMQGMGGMGASPFPQVNRTLGKGPVVQPNAPKGGSGSEIARLLASVELSNFEIHLKRLGVECAADLKYVTAQDLENMHMTVIQRRKFDQLVTTHVGGGRPSMGGAGRGVAAPAGAAAVKGAWAAAAGKGKPIGKGIPVAANLWGGAKPAAAAASAAKPTWQSAAVSPAWKAGGAMAVKGTPAAKAAAAKAAGGKSAAAAATLPNDDAVKEAEKRLRNNGNRKVYWEEVAKLKKDFKLGEKVELALKLLEPSKLNSLLRDSGDLQRMLQHAPDKDKLIRSLVARQDSTVDQLVTKLEQKENQQKSGKSSGGDAKGDAKGWKRKAEEGAGGWQKKWR